LDKDNGVANIDFDKLEFPLIWRTWRAGDVFVPLGMKQRKKVSDFLIDLKISRPRKERITVLESGGTIAWIVGHRIADPFKIKSTTSRILIIREVPAANDFV
jgi:tRNA(Ile)-lysidine synthase